MIYIKKKIVLDLVLSDSFILAKLSIDIIILILTFVSKN